MRKIDGCQFSGIFFINNGLTFFEGTRVKTFETLRDRMVRVRRIIAIRRGKTRAGGTLTFEARRHIVAAEITRRQRP
jgi:hypothetical protein